MYVSDAKLGFSEKDNGLSIWPLSLFWGINRFWTMISLYDLSH